MDRIKNKLNLVEKRKELKSIGRSLILHSKFKIVKGQLLGYANFIKPVAEIGKILEVVESK